MLRRLFASSRYIVLIPILGTFIASVGLLLYEVIALSAILVELIHGGAVLSKDVKNPAVGLIEAVDIFLIGIAMDMISIGLFTLFGDDKLHLPRWLMVQDFEDVKANLVSVVIAVLAVLFLREALALVVAALSLYLGLKKVRKG